MATYPKVGGRLYGVPFWLDAAVLIYNKDLFRQAGLDPEKPPTNRAELKEAIEKVSALGDDIYGWYFSGACQGCMVFTMIPQVWASGGDILSKDGTRATFDDPEVKAILEHYHWMWENGHVPRSAEADNGANFSTLFKAGKIGMQGVNSATVTVMKNEHPDIDFGISYLPGRLGGEGSWVGGDSITIPKGSKHPDVAWEFFAWFTSWEVQVEEYIGVNTMPIREDLFDHPNFRKDPRMQKAAMAVGVGQVPWLIDIRTVMSLPTSPWGNLYPAAIFDGEYFPEDANKEANKILAESK